MSLQNLLGRLRGVTKPESELSENTIQARFERFHEANPQVYTTLVALAFDLLEKGRKTYGVKSLFEVLRWHYTLNTHGEEFKMPNDYTSRYARFIMEKEPELSSFFVTRKLRSR